MTEVERAFAEYTDEPSRANFGASQASLNTQYANLYFARLGMLRRPLLAAAKKRWGELAKNPVKTLDAETDVQTVLLGTLYKDMKNKPNILDELNRDVFAEKVADGPEKGAAAAAAKYCGDDDALMLEDESGRIVLTGDVLQGRALVTGVVIGVRGVLKDGGEFEVDDICLPGLPTQPQLPAADAGGDRFVALVSGLHLGHETLDMLPLQMLSEYLSGLLGSGEDHATQASTVRLVVAGNSTSNATKSADSVVKGAGDPAVMKRLQQADQQALAQRVSLLDTFLTGVAASVPVDLMPGADDPCNFLLPQQPFHPCMLPHASRLETLNLCTNPHACQIDGVSFLGSAGQPLDDMLRYLPSDDRLAALVESLHFRHVAPTAPDTLGCAPFTKSDPFVVKDGECPHVYFAANQPEFAHTLIEGDEGQRVRVVMVPDFGTTRTLVLVNLRTLECSPVAFSGLDDAAPMEAE